MDNYIQLQKDSILRIGIKDANGNEIGEHLEFDLEDIELPLRVNECNEIHLKNVSNFQKKIAETEKISNVKKKGQIISLADQKKVQIFNEFYKKEIEALDLFLGNGGTEKMLNGRKPYYRMFDDIMKSLEPILPLIKQRTEDIESQIMNKYSNKDDDTLE